MDDGAFARVLRIMFINHLLINKEN